MNIVIYFEEKKNIILYEISLDNIMVIIDNCIDMCERFERIPYFVITGGDPILHPNFWTLLKILHNKKIKFSILGNPFHLTKKKL